MATTGLTQTYSIPLANNWTAYWNPQQKQYYYHNSTSNENTWVRPSTAVELATTANNAPTPELAVDQPPQQSTTAASASTTNHPTNDESTHDSTHKPRTFVDPDGNAFEWSTETNSWELQQDKAAGGPKKSTSNKRKRTAKKKKPKSTTVYFSGLPTDATVTEVDNVFKRYGVIKASGEGKLIKLYKDEQGNLKGDGTVTYLMRPAVDNVISILNGGQFRPGCTIVVQEATYGGSNKKSKTTSASSSSSSSSSATTSATTSSTTSATTTTSATNHHQHNHTKKKPRKVHNEKQKNVQRLKEAQVLTWEEGESEHKGLTIVVFKHVFNPNDLMGTNSEKFERTLEYTIASRCEKCGPLEKLTLYASHAEGVMIAKFSTSYGAEQCIATMHGTHGLDAERKMSIAYWDGEENFERRRDYTEDEKRVDEFGSWLEEGDPDEHLTELDRQNK